MRVAIFARVRGRGAVATIEHFASKGCPVSLVVIETGVRTRFSHTEMAFGAAHTEFLRIMSDHAQALPPPSRPVRFLWSRLPAGVREPIKRLLRRGPGSPAPAPDVEGHARGLGIPTVRVERHSSEATKAALEDHGIAIVLLAGSAWLIKEPLLSMKGTKVINIHQAKLPEHRSLDSLPWSLLQNDVIGHTAHFVDAGVDTGPILVFKEVLPLRGETLLTLRGRIDARRPQLYYAAVAGLADGSIVPRPQEASAGVHHHPMTVGELLLAEEALQERLRRLHGPRLDP
jgi:phosphoribosylglycinamide formyltransferase 1